MIIDQVTATATATSLKTLLEDIGHIFPNDNDSCTEVIAQIDPAEADTVEIRSAGTIVAGFTLTNDTPASLSIPVVRVRDIYLKASSGTVPVNVFVGQRGA